MLKKGGHVVFFGELGQQSQNLIHYFESRGASPIDLGDNPANWMLRNIQEEDSDNDLAEEYIKSPEYAALKHRLEEVKLNPNPALQISYQLQFAAPAEARQRLMNKRLQTIYWRSPAYNLSRILVCVIIAFILASVFITNRKPKDFTEAEVRAWLSVTFLSFIIIGILSITSVLPVMLGIRDIFYRHRAAGMLDNISLGWALGTAEKWFIVLSSFFFCLVFIGVSGLTTENTLKRSIRFWVSYDVLLQFAFLFSWASDQFAYSLRGFSRSIWLYIRTSAKLLCAASAACQRLKSLPASLSASIISSPA